MINKSIEIPEFKGEHIRFDLVFQDKVDESYIDIYDYKLDAVRATLTKAVNQKESHGITFVLTDKDNNAMDFSDPLPKHLLEASFDKVLVHFTLAYIDQHLKNMRNSGLVNEAKAQSALNEYWEEVQYELKYEND